MDSRTDKQMIAACVVVVLFASTASAQLFQRLQSDPMKPHVPMRHKSPLDGNHQRITNQKSPGGGVYIDQRQYYWPANGRVRFVDAQRQLQWKLFAGAGHFRTLDVTTPQETTTTTGPPSTAVPLPANATPTTTRRGGGRTMRVLHHRRQHR